MAVHAYHPVTKADVVVTEGQMDHLRGSGWILLSEHLDNEAAQAKADEKAAGKSKTASEEK